MVKRVDQAESPMGNARQSQIQALIDQLVVGLQEREETLAVALLGALTGQNSFLYGPPGTAKSLMARRIAQAFEGDDYFECLMNRFSTPDEVFGPVSLKELKEDRYLRQIDGYLPTARFAFLDEIWKSSPAILNTLLTLINERLFRNGEHSLPVPLMALMAASNEIPQDDQGLDALYDRFLIRLNVGPTRRWDNFEHLLQQPPLSAPLEVEGRIPLSQWQSWQQELTLVTLSRGTLAVIRHLRRQIAERSDALSLYVSDRRWQRAALLLKASAFFNDRDETNHSDALLLRHCLWSEPDHREQVCQLVEQTVFEVACAEGEGLASLYLEIDEWHEQLQTLLFHQEAVYDTVEFYPQQYFFGGEEERRQKDRNRFFYVKAMATYEHGLSRKEPVYLDFYVHQEQMNTRRPFHPMDTLGKEMELVQCQFDEHGTLSIRYNDSGNFDSNAWVVNSFKPGIRHHRGDRRDKINRAEADRVTAKVEHALQRLERSRAIAEQELVQYQDCCDTPFVPASQVNNALEGRLAQIADMELHALKCSQILALEQA
ncbi:AAA family ATPase [Ferrimonas futtsuensis]|uniref:AAA family ATPase n=1 Tax=Ferrimonas futtsuensis TaxID=364764 RepID=UPI000A057BF9|nr:AAA family ATPase [Ferrimonas futtsuensis]